MLTIILLTVLSQSVFGTTWFAAYPYKQQIDGQKVVVKAYPYDPHSGSPMIGVTKVYFNNKLLYTIDKYYRERIFTSNDGQYLVVVHISNVAGMSSFTLAGIVNNTAIEVFKNGQPFKIFTIKEVLDTTKLVYNDRFFYWGYDVDLNAYTSAKYGCRTCKKIYGRRALRTSETSAIDIEECKKKCEFVRLKKAAIRLSKNPIYVEGNSLFVLTNQNTVVKLDFVKMNIEQIPFDKIVLDIKTFNPPKLNRKYKKVNYPEKFLLPDFYNGKTFEQGLAAFLNKRVSDDSDSAVMCIYVHTLLINREGKCELVYVSPTFRNDLRKEFMYFENDIELAKEIKNWINQQTFNTKTIPKDFQKFKYSGLVYLK